MDAKKQRVSDGLLPLSVVAKEYRRRSGESLSTATVKKVLVGAEAKFRERLRAAAAGLL